MTDIGKSSLDASTDEMVPRAWFEDALRNERTWLKEAHVKIRELEQFGSRWTYEDEKGSEERLLQNLKQYGNLLIDGEVDKATEMHLTIFRNIESRNMRRAESAAKQAVALLREELNFQKAVRDVETDHPSLSPRHADFDLQVISDIRALIRGYQIELGISPSDALRRAVSRLFDPAKTKGADTAVETQNSKAGLDRIAILATVDGRVVID